MSFAQTIYKFTLLNAARMTSYFNSLNVQKCNLDVNEAFCFLNESTISSMNAVFSLACSSRPLADASDNLLSNMVRKQTQ